MVGRRQKKLNLHWLKCPKTVPKKEKMKFGLEKKMIQNLIFGVYLLISDFLAEILKAN